MQIFVCQHVRQRSNESCTLGIAHNHDCRNQGTLIGFEPRLKVFFCNGLHGSFRTDGWAGICMLSKESLHKNTHGIGVVVLSKVLDPGQLQHFFLLEIVFLKYRLLQDVHQNFQRLAQLTAETIDKVPEEIGLVDNLDSSTRVLEPPCNIFRVESLSPS